MVKLSSFFNRDKVQIVSIIVIILLVSAVLIFNYRYTEEQKVEVEKSQIDKLMEYKETYIGDAPGVGSILRILDYSEYLDKGIELKTSEQPYKLIVNYSKFEPEYAILLKNAQAIFSLVTNVDMITFNIGVLDDEASQEVDMQYCFRRQNLEKIFNRDLKEYANDVSLWKADIKVASDYTDNMTKMESLYVTVMTDIMSADSALNYEMKYIAIDMDSFKDVNDKEKAFILDYISNYSYDIKDMNFDELKNQGLFNEKTMSIDGIFVNMTSVIKTDDNNYEISARKYKSGLGAITNNYKLKYTSNKWNMQILMTAMS